ncbi:hypothetical protein PAPYR_569 [Paratrimastix pyriformis]|uniref:Uncharacterized protein n=1 Tax=Paratrimastix pyriformis TaxID=342808 RepID=A0ABQ8UXT9_9EUKA|nr:hypothetical protein PAPYR_569 [Paratrimastix pyriformis]
MSVVGHFSGINDIVDLPQTRLRHLYIHGLVHQEAPHPAVMSHRGEQLVVPPTLFQAPGAPPSEQVPDFWIRQSPVPVHSQLIVVDPFGAHPVVMLGSHAFFWLGREQEQDPSYRSEDDSVSSGGADEAASEEQQPQPVSLAAPASPLAPRPPRAAATAHRRAAAAAAVASQSDDDDAFEASDGDSEEAEKPGRPAAGRRRRQNTCQKSGSHMLVPFGILRL